MKTHMIYICSPWASEVGTWNHEQLLRQAIRQTVMAGELPLAPHAMLALTGALDDALPNEREAGLAAGLRYLDLCDEVWVYECDCHDCPTAGMLREIERAMERDMVIRYRCHKEANMDNQNAEGSEDMMFRRIRESIGDLINDAELKEIVKIAIEKSFFEPRVDYIEGYTYGELVKRVKPSLFVEQIDEILADAVRPAVESWFADNKSLIESRIDALLKEGIGIMSQVDKTLMNLIMAPLTKNKEKADE